MRGFRLTAIVCVAAALAACQSGPKGVRIVNNGSSAIPQQQGVTQHNLDGSQIGGAIIGKTFQYTRSDGNGFVSYNSDGSFDYQDDSRGNGSGRWAAAGSQYCEIWGNGPQECGVFKNTGDAYFAANSRLVEMKN
ncbi:MAG: hypothetical protein LCH46_05450 [Proteobacteria bacterium]|nr:hypothetical protein [Pseudomonadota bacterium]